MYCHNALKQAQEIEKPLLLTPNEFASMGIMSIYSIRRAIREGTLPYVKIGSHYRINYTQFLRQLNGDPE